MLRGALDSQKANIAAGMADGADTVEAGKLLSSPELDLQTYLAEVDQIPDALDELPLLRMSHLLVQSTLESGNSAPN